MPVGMALEGTRLGSRTVTAASSRSLDPERTDDGLDMTEMLVHGVQAMGGLLETPLSDTSMTPNAMGEKELSGLNFMVKAMWPYFRKAIERRGKKEMLERAAMEIEKHAEFQLHELEVDFDPGETPPTFLGVRVYRRKKTVVQDFEGLQIDADIIWKTTGFICRPKIKGVATFAGAAGMDISVQDFSITGLDLNTTGSVVLAPLVAEEPCFGAAQVFFLDLPDLKMNLSGWNSHSWFKKIVMGIMQRMTVNLLSDSYVLPHRMVVKARPDVALETMIAIKSPLPIGLLEIEVCEAKNLLALDVRPFGGSSSDPYVKIGIGEGEIKTTTVNKTTSPKWTDGPDYLPVYNLAQVVKVSVYDADVMSSDFIGHMNLFTVYALWQEMQSDCEPDGGKWFRLEGKDKNGEVVDAGQLKLKVRFMTQGGISRDEAEWDNANMAAKSACAPRLLTVKLLGLEGEAAESMMGSYCQAEYTPSAASTAVPDEGGVEKSFWNMWGGMSRRGSADSSRKKPYSRFSNPFGNSAQRGMSNERRTGKARPWSQHLNRAKSFSLPSEVVRAIEHLRYREKWADDKIASMFGISPETVHNAAELRASFEVVWHEALHFVQFPGEKPFDGCIEIALYLPRRMAKSQLHIDRVLGKVTDKSVALANAVASNGYVGSVRLNLDRDPIQPDTKWSRRVRARLRRPESTTLEAHEETQCTLHGEAQCDSSMGKVVPGMLLEFMVEIRPLLGGSPEAFVEDGQAMMGQGKIFAPGIEVMNSAPESPKNRSAR